MKTSFRGCLLLVLVAFAAAPFTRAADHADGPQASNNESADLNDLFFFLDPNDNSRVVLEMTMHGFIVPSEAVNLGIFDPEVTYRLIIEETGDTVPDAQIDITFSPKSSSTTAQIATLRMTRGSTKVFEFSAPATLPSLNPAAPTQVVTADAGSGVSFFAGEVDDPFFFDIPAFNRFVASVLAGSPDPSKLNRGRDSFAGYNTMSIALSVPKALLNSNNGVIGAEAITYRADQHPVTLFANVSTRGRVGADPDVLIGGLIINGTEVKRVILRALGPSLKSKGVADAISDPTLTLFDSHGQPIATNNDWPSNQASDITASGLAPTDPKESAIVTSLAPGAYTAVVSGANGTTGVALVEAYDVETSAEAASGALRQIDRVGIPAVNVALVPFARKDEYNSSTPQQDAAGRFANDIVGTLKALGTSDANIGTLAEVAVVHGDYLRLNLATANSGPSGGTSSGAAFPNGRRLADDTIDTILSIVTNGAVKGDNVNSNDVPLRDAFPFFALAQQPRDPGVIDDNTRN
jgi:hypothetical protein